MYHKFAWCKASASIFGYGGNGKMGEFPFFITLLSWLEMEVDRGILIVGIYLDPPYHFPFPFSLFPTVSAVKPVNSSDI